jgi:hypothetical protein
MISLLTMILLIMLMMSDLCSWMITIGQSMGDCCCCTRMIVVAGRSLLVSDCYWLIDCCQLLLWIDDVVGQSIVVAVVGRIVVGRWILVELDFSVLMLELWW